MSFNKSEKRESLRNISNFKISGEYQPFHHKTGNSHFYLVVRSQDFRLQVEIVLRFFFDEKVVLVVVAVGVAGQYHIRHLARLRPEKG